MRGRAQKRRGGGRRRRAEAASFRFEADSVI